MNSAMIREQPLGWYPMNGGKTIGTTASEGEIAVDEEHADGARITLERGGHAPFAITCGIYGWMVHTRFLGDGAEASADLESMKLALAEIVAVVSFVDDPELDTKHNSLCRAIKEFVDRFP